MIRIYLSKKSRLYGCTDDKSDIIHDKYAWRYCK